MTEPSTDLVNADGLITREQFRRLADLVLATSQGGQTFVSLHDASNGTTRFANDQIVQNVHTHRVSLSVTVSFGLQHGTATATDFGEDAIRDMVVRATEIARVSPEDPEFVKPLPPQEYVALETVRQDTALAGPEKRIAYAEAAIQQCRAEYLTAAGIVASSVAADAELLVEDTARKTVVAKQAVKLSEGGNHFSLDFDVSKPALWWPNGLGEHPLYAFKAKLVLKGQTADERSVRTGLRSLQVRQDKDEWGLSFTFVVNGVPVFGKGANWIPADSFPTRITLEKYRWLLKSAADSNMNMLRVWGGGIYESDDFYNLADEMGILVWQDFMFACSMYPGTPEFSTT